MNSKYNFDLLLPSNTMNSAKLREESPWMDKNDSDDIN